MDTLTIEQRSKLMASIRSKNTKPELAVRSIAHRMGYRFRLHVKGLPGTPDLAFASRRKAIFVNGCFWHAHKCQKGRMPTTRPDYWRDKIEANKERDKKKRRELAKLGWKSLVIWECEVKRLESLEQRIAAFLGGNPQEAKQQHRRQFVDT